MRNILKLLLIVVVLVIAVLLAAPFMISGDTIKNTIIEQVENATGRTLTIDGNLRMKFFPVVGVVAEKVTLSNPKDSGDKAPFIALNTLHVDVALMPLLRREVVIKDFELEGAVINLHVYKNGVKNWEFAPAAKNAPAAAPAVKPAGTASTPILPSNINLDNVSLKDTNISLVDEVKNSTMNLTQLNASMSLHGLDSPLKIDGSGQWQNKMVSVKAQVANLQSLLNKRATDVDMEINSDPITVSAKGSYQDEIFTGKSSIKTPSLKQTLAWLQPGQKPLATPAPLALSIDGDMHCGAALCTISGLDLALDNIKAKGNLKFAMVNNTPDINLALEVNELDFNPFLAPAKHAANGFIADAAADSGHWSNQPIDLSALRMLNLNSVIHTGGIKYQQITIGKSTLNAKIQNGKLIADVVDAELYSGKGNVSVTLDSGVNPPAIASHANLKDVALAPLLKDAMGMDRLTGKANLDYTVTSQGVSEQSIISALAGNGQIKVTDGTIERVNILDLLHNLQGGSNSKTTAFSEMGGTFTITKGDISNQDLVLKMTGMNVSGKGDVNLPAYTINYRLMPQTMGKGQAGTAQAGLGVPVIISGSLDNPSFRPDIGSVIQNALQDPKQFKEQLKNNERGLKGVLQNPAGATNNLKGLLKGLQGN